MKLLKRLFNKLFKRTNIIQFVVRDDLTPLEGVKISVSGHPIIDDTNKKPVENEMHVSRKIIIFTKYKNMYLISLVIAGVKIICPFPDGTLFTDKIPLMNIKEHEFDYMMNKFRESNYDINVEVME